MNFLTFSTDEFQSRCNVLHTSIWKHHPECFISHFKIPSIEEGVYVPGLAKIRLEEGLKVLETSSEDIVIIGSDCEFMAPLDEITDNIYDYDVMLVPHVKVPVSDRNTMAQLYRTGHANADLMVFRNTDNGRAALKWLISVTQDYEPGSGIFYEQTWASALPFLFDKVYIIRDKGYNVGYWDIMESSFQEKNNEYFIDNVRVKMVQYSGYVKGQPEKMSKHQNKYTAYGDVLKLYQRYDQRIS